MSDNLDNLSNKLTCYNFSVQRLQGKLRIFKLSKPVTSKEVKPIIKRIFGAGFTKLFDIEDVATGRYPFLEISEK